VNYHLFGTKVFNLDSGPKLGKSLNEIAGNTVELALESHSEPQLGEKLVIALINLETEEC
jgi:hypothetical protein